MNCNELWMQYHMHNELSRCLCGYEQKGNLIYEKKVIYNRHLPSACNAILVFLPRVELFAIGECSRVVHR